MTKDLTAMQQLELLQSAIAKAKFVHERTTPVAKAVQISDDQRKLQQLYDQLDKRYPHARRVVCVDDKGKLFTRWVQKRVTK